MKFHDVQWRMLVPPLALVVAIMLACCNGQYSVSVSEFVQSFAGLFHRKDLTAQPSDVDMVLWHIRFPRILAGILVGASLAMAGATYQGMFRNPLVSPDILGVSAGAGLGAVIAIYLGMSIITVQVVAFVCGMVSVFLVYMVSQLARYHDPVLALVLSGIAVAAAFGSGIALVKIISDPYGQLMTITFWLMGALNTVVMEDITSALPLMVISMIPLILLRWRMNLLSLDDDEALALGVNVKRTRIIFIISATMMTSAAGAITGVIGWVGLVIPHIARLLIGPDFRKLLPASFFIGATFLVLTDLVARSFFPIEIPIGIVTAFVGAPFFLGLMIKGGVRK